MSDRDPRTLISYAPFDGRTLFELDAEPAMLFCLERLKSGTFDAVDEWLLVSIMEEGWGLTARVKQALAQFMDSSSDELWLRGLTLLHGYSVAQDRSQEFLTLTLCDFQSLQCIQRRSSL